MAEKTTVSIRFDGKGDNRISFEEWQGMQPLISFFKMTSAGQLVEAALHYTLSQKNETERQETVKSIPETLPHINQEKYALLLDSIEKGYLTKEVQFDGQGIAVTIFPGTRIHLYSPYVICIEPAYDMRIALDVSKDFSMDEEGKKIIIHSIT